MSEYIIEYYDDEKKYIKFEGFKNNNKNEGVCKVGYIKEYNEQYYNEPNIFWILYEYYYTQVNFINNIKHGDYEIYKCPDEYGSYYYLYEKGTYINNLKEGTYFKYDDYGNGNIVEKGTYINNLKEGTYFKYNAYGNGNIVEKGTYINNLKEGIYYNYDDDNNVIGTGFYKNNIWTRQ
jgi:hypothetical protein